EALGQDSSRARADSRRYEVTRHLNAVQSAAPSAAASALITRFSDARVHAERIDDFSRGVADVSVAVQRLRITEIATERIGCHEAAEARIVIPSKCIIEACLCVPLVAGELVVLRAGIGERPSFLPVGIVISIVAFVALYIRDYPHAAQVVREVEVHVPRAV